MDSLHYIAEQLNVDISTLVNDNHIEEIRELLLNVEEQFYNIKDPYNKKEIELIEHILKKITIINMKSLPSELSCMRSCPDTSRFLIVKHF